MPHGKGKKQQIIPGRRGRGEAKKVKQDEMPREVLVGFYARRKMGDNLI